MKSARKQKTENTRYSNKYRKINPNSKISTNLTNFQTNKASFSIKMLTTNTRRYLSTISRECTRSAHSRLINKSSTRDTSSRSRGESSGVGSRAVNYVDDVSRDRAISREISWPVTSRLKTGPCLDFAAGGDFIGHRNTWRPGDSARGSAWRAAVLEFTFTVVTGKCAASESGRANERTGSALVQKGSSPIGNFTIQLARGIAR